MNDFPEFEIFQDYSGADIKFQYVFFDVGRCYSVKAHEVKVKEPGRVFSAYDNNDPVNVLLKIRKIIKEELNTRYFTESAEDKFDSMNFDYFQGNIADGTNSEICMVVDGKEMTIKDFQHFLEPYNGYRIEIKITEE